MRKRMKKRIPSPHRQANGTSVAALKRKPLDKKAALRSRIQEILSGRSRFVIRKVPAVKSSEGKETSGGVQTTLNGQVEIPPSLSNSREEEKKDRWVLRFTCQVESTSDS